MAMATLPALALRPDGEHFIVAKVSEDTVLIHDLALQRARVMPLDEFRRLYDGRLLQVTSRATVLGQLAKFRSEEHTSELQSLMRISYAVFCLKKKKNNHTTSNNA